jgi:hypothetical protein
MDDSKKRLSGLLAASSELVDASLSFEKTDIHDFDAFDLIEVGQVVTEDNVAISQGGAGREFDGMHLSN